MRDIDIDLCMDLCRMHEDGAIDLEKWPAAVAFMERTVSELAAFVKDARGSGTLS